MKRAFIFAALVALTFAGVASADTLQVSSGVGTDPTVIGTTGFTMLFNPTSGSLDDLTLLFSVPTGDSAPSGLTASLGTLGSISLVGNLAGSSTCKNSNLDVYTCAGLSGANSSNGLMNFNTANQMFNGITALSYDIYSVTITGVNMVGKDTIDIGGTFGVGTFIDGYGTNGSAVYDTAFTDAGLTTSTTPTPEPASLLLLGLGLSGVTFLRRLK